MTKPGSETETTLRQDEQVASPESEDVVAPRRGPALHGRLPVPPLPADVTVKTRTPT